MKAREVRMVARSIWLSPAPGRTALAAPARLLRRLGVDPEAVCSDVDSNLARLVVKVIPDH
jgi:hypothetical protein